MGRLLALLLVIGIGCDSDEEQQVESVANLGFTKMEVTYSNLLFASYRDDELYKQDTALRASTSFRFPFIYYTEIEELPVLEVASTSTIDAPQHILPALRGQLHMFRKGQVAGSDTEDSVQVDIELLSVPYTSRSDTEIYIKLTGLEAGRYLRTFQEYFYHHIYGSRSHPREEWIYHWYWYYQCSDSSLVEIRLRK